MRGHHQVARVLVWALLGVLAAGCASPAARFYKLSAVSAPPQAALSTPAALSVVVGPVSIPALVDRPQFVLSSGANEVRVDEFNRWAAPLADDIGRVVAEDLVVLLATPQVTLYAQQAGEAAQYRVAIGVQRFESTPGQAVLLDAVWSVRRTRDGASQSGRTTLTEPSPDPGYDQLAAAHSRALSQLGSDIASAVRELDAQR